MFKVETDIDATSVTPAGEFDRFLFLLGKLNYFWSNTESLLIHMIAGLVPCDKEAATLIFLTMATFRARTDLVERLAKRDGVDPSDRETVLALTRELTGLASLRNRYNHCIYAFDPVDGAPRSILMRISDRKADLKVGRETSIDGRTVEELSRALAEVAGLNRRFWHTIQALGYPL